MSSARVSHFPAPHRDDMQIRGKPAGVPRLFVAKGAGAGNILATFWQHFKTS